MIGKDANFSLEILPSFFVDRKNVNPITVFVLPERAELRIRLIVTVFLCVCVYYTRSYSTALPVYVFNVNDNIEWLPCVSLW